MDMMNSIASVAMQMSAAQLEQQYSISMQKKQWTLRSWPCRSCRKCCRQVLTGLTFALSEHLMIVSLANPEAR